VINTSVENSLNKHVNINYFLNKSIQTAFACWFC